MSPSARLVPIGLGAVFASVMLTWLLQPPQRKSSQDAPSFVVAEAPSVAHASVAAAAPRCGATGSLTDEQVLVAVRDFMPGVLPCVSAPHRPASTLQLRLHVACTGAIEGVQLLDRGDWPAKVVGCVQERLARVSFPAHGVANGAVVDLPMRFPPLDGSSRGR